MPLSSFPQIIGLHSMVIRDVTTKEPLSYVKLVKELNLDFKGTFVDAKAGTFLVPTDSTLTELSSEATFTCQELRGNLLAIASGNPVVMNPAEPAGAVINFGNVKGTSVKSATAGIASISVTSGQESRLKRGAYILKGVDADTAKLYSMSDLDFRRGAQVSFLDDSLEVATLDFAAGDAVLADFGLTFHKGSGTMAMQAGDTAEFDVRIPNRTSYELEFGGSDSEFKEVNLLAMSGKSQSGKVLMVELYRVAIGGFPLSLKEKAYAEFQLSMKVMVDLNKDKIGKISYIDPV